MKVATIAIVAILLTGCAASKDTVHDGDRQTLDQTDKGLVIVADFPGLPLGALEIIKVLQLNIQHLIATYGRPEGGGKPFSSTASKEARDTSEKQHLPQAGSMIWTALLGVGTTVLGFAVRSGGISAIPFVGPFLSPLVGKFSERLVSGANASDAITTTLHEGVDQLAKEADERKTKIMALVEAGMKDSPLAHQIEMILIDGKQTWAAIDGVLAHKNLGGASDKLYEKYVKPIAG